MNTSRLKTPVTSWLLICVAGILLSACGVELLTTTAIRGELESQNVRHATQQLDHVQRRMGALNFNQAVQAYRAEHGVNPPSLEALVPKYLAEMPRKADGAPYYYDPATGTLSETPVAGGIPPADQQMMAAIRAAINQYGTATGFYPPTLDALYPNYLAQWPRTTAGESFLYNNQNGDVTHPRAHAAHHLPAAPPAGGVGPMGGMMTGAGMQPGGGGNNAAAAVRSHARGGAEGIADQNTARQNRVMDDLGL